MKQSTPQEYLSKLTLNEEFVCYVPFYKKTILRCIGSTINELEATRRGYTIVDVPMSGGSIVLSYGDVAFGFINKNLTANYRQIVLGTITKKLKSLGLNAEMNNNDITVDGYKCVGYVQSVPNPNLCVAISVSMSANLEDINAICTKEMKKIPKGLSDFGVNKQDIIDSFYEIEDIINSNYEYNE